MKLFFYFSFLILISCASGPKFEKPTQTLLTNQHGLFIYRNSGVTGMVQQPGIRLDGKEIFDLKNGGYKYLIISQGNHTVELTDVGGVFASISFKADSQKTSYLRYEILLGDTVRAWRKKADENLKQAVADYSKKRFESDTNVVEFSHVNSGFDPRLFFAQESLALKEIVATRLIP